MIDGGTDAGRGEMKRGVALTWRCNAPPARDLTGTWAAAAAAAVLLANKASICRSASFWGAVMLRRTKRTRHI